MNCTVSKNNRHGDTNMVKFHKTWLKRVKYNIERKPGRCGHNISFASFFSREKMAIE